MIEDFAWRIHVEILGFKERRVTPQEFFSYLAAVAGFTATLGTLAGLCAFLAAAILAQCLAIHLATALAALAAIPLSMMPSLLRRQRMRALALESVD